MVDEANKFAEQDKEQVKLIESKNNLENYCYNIRNTINESKSVNDDDKKTILD